MSRQCTLSKPLSSDFDSYTMWPMTIIFSDGNGWAEQPVPLLTYPHKASMRLITSSHFHVALLWMCDPNCTKGWPSVQIKVTILRRSPSPVEALSFMWTTTPASITALRYPRYLNKLPTTVFELLLQCFVLWLQASHFLSHTSTHTHTHKHAHTRTHTTHTAQV